MSREKLKKEIREVVSKQVTLDKADINDLYPIDGDILAYAYDYVPIKILKRIIKRHTEDKWKIKIENYW